MVEVWDYGRGYGRTGVITVGDRVCHSEYGRSAECCCSKLFRDWLDYCIIIDWSIDDTITILWDSVAICDSFIDNGWLQTESGNIFWACKVKFTVGSYQLQSGAGREGVRAGHRSQVPQCGYDHGGHECGRDARVSSFGLFIYDLPTYNNRKMFWWNCCRITNADYGT